MSSCREEAYAAHVGELQRLHGANLHLDDVRFAFDCAHGEPTALRQLKEEYLPLALASAAHLMRSAANREETSQRVLEKLIVSSPGKPCRLLQYTGKGALGAWLRMVAIRTATDVLDSTRAGREAEGIFSSFVTARDPELELIHTRDRPAFDEALRRATEGLESKDRLVLRLYTVDNLTLDEIGRMHDVNRSTVWRWLAQARHRLLEAFRAELSRTLGLTSAEVESLLRVVQSRLDLSGGAFAQR